VLDLLNNNLMLFHQMLSNLRHRHRQQSSIHHRHRHQRLLNNLLFLNLLDYQHKTL
jgi:hypothetical protein